MLFSSKYNELVSLSLKKVSLHNRTGTCHRFFSLHFHSIDCIAETNIPDYEEVVNTLLKWLVRSQYFLFALKQKQYSKMLLNSLKKKKLHLVLTPDSTPNVFKTTCEVQVTLHGIRLKNKLGHSRVQPQLTDRLPIQY